MFDVVISNHKKKILGSYRTATMIYSGDTVDFTAMTPDTQLTNGRLRASGDFFKIPFLLFVNFFNILWKSVYWWISQERNTQWNIWKNSLGGNQINLSLSIGRYISNEWLTGKSVILHLLDTFIHQLDNIGLSDWTGGPWFIQA